MAVAGNQKTRDAAAGCMRFGNPFVSFLLQSPLRGLLGGKFMLITVTGRKTGRTYTTPVNYVREGDTLTVISRQDRTWWRNLSDPAPVLVRLRSNQRAGIGQVIRLAEADRLGAVKDFYEAFGLHPDVKKVESTAKDAVVIRIELEGGR